MSCCEDDCKSVTSDFYFELPKKRDVRTRRQQLARREWNGMSEYAIKYFYEGRFGVSSIYLFKNRCLDSRSDMHMLCLASFGDCCDICIYVKKFM